MPRVHYPWFGRIRDSAYPGGSRQRMWRLENRHKQGLQVVVR